MNRSLNGLAILQGTYSDSGSEHDETDDSNEIGSSPLSEDHVQHKVVDTNLTHVELKIEEPQVEADSLWNLSAKQEADQIMRAPELKSDSIQAEENDSETSPTANMERNGLPSSPLSYRVSQVDDSDSDSSSDESDHNVSVADIVDVADVPDEDDDEVEENLNAKKKSKMMEALGIIDLPPLEELTITVPQEECIPIGKISNIIDTLVIVVANKGTPAVDLDSVLFLDQGLKTLGLVFDVFGPVSEPMYMVRFNAAEDITAKDVTVGLTVYYAPRTQHTTFVFLESLVKMKGSDASWEHDKEPPAACIDYSDDEEERRAKAALRMKKSAGGPDGASATQSHPRKKRQKSNSHHPAASTNRGGQYPPPNPFYMREPPTSAVGYPNYSFHHYAPSNNPQNYPPPNAWSVPPPPPTWAPQGPLPTWPAPGTAVQHQPSSFGFQPTLGCLPQFRPPLP